MAFSSYEMDKYYPSGSNQNYRGNSKRSQPQQQQHQQQNRSRSQSVLDELHNAFPSNSELIANISRVMACLEEDASNKNSNQQQQQQQPSASSRYKTELCRPFEENGHCKYGDKCQFAHGGNELRSLSRHPKYKTEPCRTFHTTGICPYGPRCHFIHSKDRTNQPPMFCRPKGLSLSSVSSTNSELSSLNSDSGSIGSHSPSSSPTFHDGEFANAMNFFGYSNSHVQQHNNVPEVDPLDELAYTLSACQLNQRRQLASYNGSVESLPGTSASSLGSPIDLSRGLNLPGIFGNQFSDQF